MDQDQLIDFVEKWVAANPDRLLHLYNNPEALADWMAEGAERIRHRNTLTQSGHSVLDSWATSAEQAHAAGE